MTTCNSDWRRFTPGISSSPELPNAFRYRAPLTTNTIPLAKHVRCGDKCIYSLLSVIYYRDLTRLLFFRLYHKCPSTHSVHQYPEEERRRTSYSHMRSNGRMLNKRIAAPSTSLAHK